VAEVQGVSVRTVKRQWQVARIWLLAELGGATADDVPAQPDASGEAD
jgi:hypothetical protein